MPKKPHFAFKQDNPLLVNRLVTEAVIFPVPIDSKRKPVTVMALWDTGATGSVITPRVSKALSLAPINRRTVTGVNNTSIVDVVRISVGLPNKVMIEAINVSVCNLTEDIDMLIGMDIILTGDLSISNAGGKTLFTFAVPPFENKTDLYEKTLAVNKRNKV